MKHTNESKQTIVKMAVILSLTGSPIAGGAIVQDNSLEKELSELAQNPVPDSPTFSPSASRAEHQAVAARAAAIDRMVSQGGNYRYGVRSHIRAMRG